jgi:hypothetical protein
MAPHSVLHRPVRAAWPQVFDHHLQSRGDLCEGHHLPRQYSRIQPRRGRHRRGPQGLAVPHRTGPQRRHLFGKANEPAARLADDPPARRGAQMARQITFRQSAGMAGRGPNWAEQIAYENQLVPSVTSFLAWRAARPRPRRVAASNGAPTACRGTQIGRPNYFSTIRWHAGRGPYWSGKTAFRQSPGMAC